MDIEHFLAYCQENIITISPLSKIPQQDGWLVSPSPYPDTPSAMLAHDLGFNLGLRIPKGVLVIDVDPKNGGEESFRQLPAEVQELQPFTVTPSGGYHIYTKLPDADTYRTLRTTLKEEYPGIDFLHHGRQVLLPGSTLGANLDYTIHPNASFPPHPTPDSLLDLLTKAPLQEQDTPSGALTSGELYQLLQTIPVTDYNDNDTWLQLLFACHHATNGDGLEAFLAWSLEDPKYSHDEEKIRGRWSSASVDRDQAITGRTLCRIVKRHQGHIPAWLKIKLGMTDAPDAVFGDESTGTTSVQVIDKYRAMIAGAAEYTDIVPGILYKIIADPILLESHRDMLYREIATKTGVRQHALHKDIKALSQDSMRRTETRSLTTPLGDIAVDESQIVLRMAHALIERVAEDYHDIQPLFFNNQWWVWSGTHWSSEIGEADMKRKALRVIQSFGVKVTASLTYQVVDVARIELSGLGDGLYPDPNEIAVFARNKAIKYDTKNNLWKVEDHNPENKNPYTIECMLDPDAPEPFHWFRFIDEVVTSEHAKRTLACGIVYAAGGSIPWLRKFFFFYGPSRTGKSTTLDLIEGILGKRNCSALNMHQLSSRFGPAGLVGKLANVSNETMSKKAFNDDVFKAIVSGESITIEPKHQDSFAYRNRAKCFVASNGFPRIEDESEGVWDRLVLFSFQNETPYDEADHRLHQKLMNERSGILNWAMEIFREEYQKDECRSIMLPDTVAREDIDTWRRTNNPALQWARERLTRTGCNADTVTRDEAYSDYVVWAKQDGHRQQAKNAFSRVIGRAVPMEVGGRERRILTGVKLMPLEYFDNLSN